jgi:hypothetical protein
MPRLVFPARPDLGSRNGDNGGRRVGSAGTKVQQQQRTTCLSPQLVSANDNKTSVNNTCDESLPRHPQTLPSRPSPPSTTGRDPSPPKLSYSVNFFNWSVSDCSSEEEDGNDCKTVTMSLNRLKIRKSSKERNEKARGVPL